MIVIPALAAADVEEPQTECALKIPVLTPNLSEDSLELCISLWLKRKQGYYEWSSQNSYSNTLVKNKYMKQTFQLAIYAHFIYVTVTPPSFRLYIPTVSCTVVIFV